MIVLLVTGRKRSGKDWVANQIQQLSDKKVEVLSFATPLKQIIAGTFGITIEDLDELKNTSRKLYAIPHNMSNGVYEAVTDFRKILQRFGTEGMKPIFGEDVWVRLIIDKINASDADVVVIPDWRFNIETEGIKKAFDNVYTLRVKNDTVSSDDVHKSETELDGYPTDFVLDNTEYVLKHQQVFDIIHLITDGY